MSCGNSLALLLNLAGDVIFNLFKNLQAKMTGVIQKFFIASLLMWAAPLAILYGFNHNLLPGSANLSPYSTTLASGFLAVISVNIVIVFYIIMAMREPADKHVPDPKFLAEAKASMNQSTGDSPQPNLKKQD